MTQQSSICVPVTSFAYTNASGGTGMSDMGHDEHFSGLAMVQVERGFYDYESGYRFIGKSGNAGVTAYLERVGNKEDRRIFFSEFELANRSDLQKIKQVISLD